MDLILGILVRRKMAAQLHDLPPRLLRDIGLDPAHMPRVPAKGARA
ncbi:MAG: DUF1127 domain-containing protein [Exiguobacterium profundum]|nr:MAG: DUF1127 domain-containing protein [Exiguobacterium profundum]